MTAAHKNVYEELIDQMMIEEVSGLDKDIRETLEGLSTNKKRMAILSILDKDRDLFLKVKNMMKDETLGKYHYSKEIVKMLREYVKVGEVEKKAFGEVMTPIYMVQEMLDTLPKSTWSNPNIKFLDPCAGVGIFPSIIVNRLMYGLKEFEPNEELRYKHIVENQLFVGELQAKNMFLFLCAFDPEDKYALNIYNGSFLDEGFDNHMKGVWEVDKFDVIAMNSPYQTPIDGNNRMKTLYNLFIGKSLELSEKVLSIHPSRWMAGGFGLDDFRDGMFKRTDIKLIQHFDDARAIFGNNVEIKGGVQYLLIDKAYKGEVSCNGVKCNLTNYDIFVEPKFYTLIEKISKEKSLSTICKSKSYWMNFNDNTLDLQKEDNNLLCYVSQNKGLKKYIPTNKIPKNSMINIDKYKVFTPYATGSTGNLGYFGNKIIGLPQETCSNTYMTFFVNSKEEAESLVSYMSTEFCQFLLSLRKNTQNMKPDTMKWIPLVPFDRAWSDEMLFDYFKLSQKEINLIFDK